MQRVTWVISIGRIYTIFYKKPSTRHPKFKKLLELCTRKELRNFKNLCAIFHSFRKPFSPPRILKVSTTVCFMCLKANKPYDHYESQCFLRFCFRFHYNFFGRLRNFQETFGTEMWLKIKILLLVSLES